MIGVLAATLAVCQVAERGAQIGYLAHYIGGSNEYAFYQSRQNRALVLTQTAEVLRALPSTPATQQTIATATAEAARLTEDSERGNGAKQIVARAEAENALRDKALHRYEWYELVTSAIEIAIVLGSASVITKLQPVLWLAGAIGAGAAGVAAGVAAGAL